MRLTNKAMLMTVATACAIVAAALGVSPAAVADPPPLPPPPNYEEPPAWAPKKPAEVWEGQPVVWHYVPFGGHWGVWLNGAWMSLT